MVQNLSSGLLQKSQQARSMTDMQMLIQFLLLQLENSDVVSMSQQSVKQTIEDDLESQELSQHIQNELDDGVRIQIAQELKSKIEQKIKI
jgi:hypothetical protein